ncbi:MULTISPECIES: hypothetical protein [unclassified Corynebacterium]|uniref:hypothetical protein n=1 Tax=unclassified Corynebacterium TaxID=2624378 RepID=UPI0029C9DD80|nr:MULTISPECIES: hypothetical protein [unclassified Corynebacterium]WPF65962.1 hypothetical protein OLX12_10470 [Corynebacterium sp. 22KM0430]WPF68455.1 hypothetical protein OLW90_10465 [Corynebacterium sp. 21KM1197]
MIYSFEISQTFIRPTTSDEPFDVFLDRVMNEADKIDLELDYGADLHALRATWHITVEEESHLEALISATSGLRTALHAAYCATPHWVTREELESVHPVNNNELTSA